jgi:hypothetical protein
MSTIADDLSRLDTESRKIHEEKSLTLLSGLENSSISNFKLKIPMHTSLSFKEKEKSRNWD